MTPEECGLLLAIREDPDDDAPRLIYADWLDDNGQPLRGEFIRAQIANFRRGVKHGDGLNRELEILNEFPAFLGIGCDDMSNYGWNGTGETDIEYNSGAEATYSRGFIDAARCSLSWWERHGEIVAAVHPVGGVRLINKSPSKFQRSVADGGDWAWGWMNPELRWSEHGKDLLDREEAIPHKIAVFLTGGSFNGLRYEYPTKLQAEEDLSEACLRWARSHP